MNAKVLLVQVFSLLRNVPHPTAKAWGCLVGLEGAEMCAALRTTHLPGKIALDMLAIKDQTSSLGYFVLLPCSCLSGSWDCLKPLVRTGTLY